MSLIKRFSKKNVGNFDRALRLLPFFIFVYAWQYKVLTGGILVTFGVISAMLLFTALTARCSIYAMLGLSSCKLKDNNTME